MLIFRSLVSRQEINVAVNSDKMNKQLNDLFFRTLPDEDGILAEFTNFGKIIYYQISGNKILINPGFKIISLRIFFELW